MDPAHHFLIAGATGRQGGAVVNALLSETSMPIDPSSVHVITRNATSTAATQLSQRGTHVITGYLNAPSAVFNQLQSLNIKPQQVGVFLAQAHGPTELNDAKGFINAAIAYGVSFFVYSSVDRGGKEASDRDPSHCKTFSDKYHVEKHLIAAAAEHRKNLEAKGSDARFDYTILRPTWFADNAEWGFPGRLCMAGWKYNMKGKAMQVVVTKDIGRWAVEALLRPDASGIRNEALSIASEKLTFQEIDDIHTEVTGAPVALANAWLAGAVIWVVKDLRTMFEFIDSRDYGADLPELRKTLKPTTFREWLIERKG